MPFFSISGMVMLYLFCMMRMVLPVELPFVRIVQTSHLYNQLTRIFWRSGQDGAPNMLFVGIWGIGMAASTIWYACHYYHSIKEIRGFEKRGDLKVQAVMEEEILEKGRRIKPTVLLSPTVRVPMSIGVIKKYILLPDKEYSRQDLYYILKHEYMHLANGDLTIKMLVQLMCCIYWWNPLVYWLRKDLEQALEIKCDLAVTRNMGNEEKADYLAVIVSAIKDAKDAKELKGKGGGAGHMQLLPDKYANIKERFEIVSKYRGLKYEMAAKAGMFVFFLIMFIFSYSFVIQSKFEAPLEEIEEGGAYELKILEDYIIKGKDGTYKMLLPDGSSLEFDELGALMMQEAGFRIIEEGRDEDEKDENDSCNE